jgi:hypothetical protein
MPIYLSNIWIYPIYSTNNITGLETMFDTCVEPPVLESGSFAEVYNDKAVNLHKFLFKKVDNTLRLKVILKCIYNNDTSIGPDITFRKELNT